MSRSQGLGVWVLVLIAAFGVSCFLLPSSEDNGVPRGNDLQAPLVTISSPADGFATNLLSVLVTGTASDANRVASVVVFGCVDGGTPDRSDPCYPQTLAAGTVAGNVRQAVQATSLADDYAVWQAEIAFFGGNGQVLDYTVKAAAVDDRGNYDADSAITVTVDLSGPDLMGPELTVLTPRDGQLTGSPVIPVVGKSRDRGVVTSITIDAGGGPVPVESYYGFAWNLDIWRLDVVLAPGVNTLTITAADDAVPPNTTVITLDVNQDLNDDMVLITTPGAVTLGQTGGASTESPEHLVNLSDYYLDRYETTVEDFMPCYYTLYDPADFLSRACWQAATDDFIYEDVLIPSWSPRNPYGVDDWDQLIYPRPGHERYPVTGTSQFLGQWGYCLWNGNKRLPTEAEWERAARAGNVGPDFLPDGRLYPWGDTPPDCSDGDTMQEANVKGCDGHLVSVDDPRFPPNPLGLYQLAGNAMEWVQDYYQDDYYADLKAIEPVLNPMQWDESASTCIYGNPGMGIPPSLFCFVNRGGAYTSGPSIARSTYRNYYDDATGWGYDFMNGFRCAMDAP